MLGRILKGVSLLHISIFVSVAVVSAQTIGTSARHMDKGEWKVSVLYQGVLDQNLQFNVNGGGTCQSATASATFPCGGAAQIAGEGSGEAFLAKFTYQPHETGLQYYVTAGAGNYALKVDSVTVVNSLTGNNQGFLYGGGVKAVVWPDSLVTPAIAFDLSLMHQRYAFNEVRPANTAAQGQIDERLDLFTLQLAAQMSKRFEIQERITVEPYGGVKVQRTRAWLKDNVTGQRFGGVTTRAMPFFGIQIPIMNKKEVLFAEASFVNGIQYATGLSLSFG